MILFDKPGVVTIEYDASIPCVIWTPTGSVIGNDFREPFMIGVEHVVKEIKNNPNVCWLNDARKLETTKKEDLEWLNENVNLKAYEVGMKKLAFVLPEHVFGKLGIRLYAFNTMRRSDNKLNIKAFQTIEEARLWLKGGANLNLNEIRLTINQ